jgi:hypothetical protein
MPEKPAGDVPYALCNMSRDALSCALLGSAKAPHPVHGRGNAVHFDPIRQTALEPNEAPKVRPLLESFIKASY